MLFGLITSLVLNLLLIVKPWRQGRAINDFGHGIFLPAPDDPRWETDVCYNQYNRGTTCYKLGAVKVFPGRALEGAEPVVSVGDEGFGWWHASKYRWAVHRAYVARKALESIE